MASEYTHESSRLSGFPRNQSSDSSEPIYSVPYVPISSALSRTSNSCDLVSCDRPLYCTKITIVQYFLLERFILFFVSGKTQYNDFHTFGEISICFMIKLANDESNRSCKLLKYILIVSTIYCCVIWKKVFENIFEAIHPFIFRESQFLAGRSREILWLFSICSIGV